MTHAKRFLFFFSLAAFFLLIGCAQPGPGTRPATPTLDKAKLANPAAAYCQDQGFRYEIRQDDQGNETGICIFDDGSECDAWAYFRGECGQNQAKNLKLNLVEQADLNDTIRIEILAPKTTSVDPDASRHPREGGMELILTVEDRETVHALVAPLDATLPLVPPKRCPAPYELRFHLKDGRVQTFHLGICGLFGDQDYWQGMTIRPPQAFVKTFNALLEK